MIILDSNVWIALLHKNDSQHQKALQVLDGINNKNLVLPDFIFSEVLTVLKLKASIPHCHAFVKLIQKIELSVEHLSENYFIEANQYFFSNKCSFVDCYLCALRKANYKIITFDEELKKALVSTL